jgi:hypothetical protein
MRSQTADRLRPNATFLQEETFMRELEQFRSFRLGGSVCVTSASELEVP